MENSHMNRMFTNPNAGREIRIEQQGRDVRLIIVCGDLPKAESLARNLLKQVKAGQVNMTVLGKITSIEEE